MPETNKPTFLKESQKFETLRIKLYYFSNLKRKWLNI